MEKDKNKKIKKENKPQKDVLTTVGDLSWKEEKDENSINADEMFDTPPIAGSSGVEC
jgi:hypothetical protein